MDSNLLIALWMAVQVPFVVWLSKGKRFAADEIPVFERYRTRVFVQSGGMLGTICQRGDRHSYNDGAEMRRE